jgi:hypothetical protein
LSIGGGVSEYSDKFENINEIFNSNSVIIISGKWKYFRDFLFKDLFLKIYFELCINSTN